LIFALVLVFAASGQAALVADYQFMDDLSSSVGGAADLNPLGGGSFVTASVDSCSVTAWGFPAQTGLDLDVSGLISGDEYTVVMLFEAQEVYEYAKLLDTQDRVIDEGLYFEDYDLYFYDEDYGETDLVAPGVFFQVAVSRDAAGNYVGYIDGVEQLSFVDSSNYATVSAADRLVFFRDDLDTSDSENTAGTVARIRIYDNALSASEVAALDRLSAGQSCSQPIPATSPAGVVAFVILLAIAATAIARRAS
jgi:hypothetical protein